MRAVAEFAAGRDEIARERFVDAEHQVQGPREDERRFALDIGQRRVGGEPDDGALVGIADVVAADGMLGERLAIVVGRTKPDGDARQAGDRLDDANRVAAAETRGRTAGSAARNR